MSFSTKEAFDSSRDLNGNDKVKTLDVCEVEAFAEEHQEPVFIQNLLSGVNTRQNTQYFCYKSKESLHPRNWIEQSNTKDVVNLIKRNFESIIYNRIILNRRF